MRGRGERVRVAAQRCKRMKGERERRVCLLAPAVLEETRAQHTIIRVVVVVVRGLTQKATTGVAAGNTPSAHMRAHDTTGDAVEGWGLSRCGQGGVGT